ncbi:MAG TPA: ribulose-phosphate 3-epimerase [Planctomycetota bacterium]|nr:ribulose-phosphate 3-epimerase [Planctomycetota bacterium]
MAKAIRLAPSILNADYGALKAEIQKAEAGGADQIHVDIMDAHFVPNLSMGPPLVESIRKATKLPLDLHLMIMQPEKFVEPFAKAGADSITFHAEAVAHDYARKYKDRGWAMQLVCKDFFDRPRLERTLELIRKAGKKAAVALNPETDVEVIDFLDRVDMVLTMTVWPGFGGQKFMDDVLPKVSRLRKRAPGVDIEVDGGVDLGNVARAAAAGANVIVAGTSVFHAPDPAAVLREMRERAGKAYGV